MTGQMSSFFDEMLEAAKAKEALPTIQSERDHAIARNKFLEDRVTELGNRIVAIQAELAAKEVALRDATKSATSNKGNLDLLLDEVRKAMGQVMVATEVVDPKPEPIVDNTANPPEVIDLPNPLLPSGQSAQMTGEDTSPEGWRAISEAPPPFHTAFSEVPAAPFAAPTSSPGSDPSTGIGETTQTPSGQSDVGPTVSSTVDAIPPTIATPLSTADTPSPTTSFKPDPKPYWLKPSNLTWGEWKELGNDVPYWATDDANILNTV